MKEINNNIVRAIGDGRYGGEHVSSHVFVCGRVEERQQQRHPRVMTQHQVPIMSSGCSVGQGQLRAQTALLLL